jgi:hypothetical protein
MVMPHVHRVIGGSEPSHHGKTRTDVVIKVDGEEWGTAREIAGQLGHGVTEAAVRKWATRDGLSSARVRRDDGRAEVRFPLVATSRIDRSKKLSGRGRRRK